MGTRFDPDGVWGKDKKQELVAEQPKQSWQERARELKQLLNEGVLAKGRLSVPLLTNPDIEAVFKEMSAVLSEALEYLNKFGQELDTNAAELGELNAKVEHLQQEKASLLQAQEIRVAAIRNLQQERDKLKSVLDGRLRCSECDVLIPAGKAYPATRDPQSAPVCYGCGPQAWELARLVEAATQVTAKCHPSTGLNEMSQLALALREIQGKGEGNES